MHALQEVVRFRGGCLRSVVGVVLRGGVDVDAAHAYLCVCASVRACERASVRACERASSCLVFLLDECNGGV